MSEPVTSPKTDLIHGIENGVSTSPVQGSGLSTVLNDLSNETQHMGRVDDIFMGGLCAIVSLYGKQSRLPCIWGTGAANRIYGTKTVDPMTIGTEVLVYVSSDTTYGIITSIIHSSSASTGIRPVGQIAPECGVNHWSDKTTHNPKAWGVNDSIVNVATGMPVDTMPGDWGAINENNGFIGLLRLLAVIKGSELAKMECHSIDDLVRVTSHNWQHFTSMGEEKITCEFNRVDKEELATSNFHEALGATKPDSDIQKDNPSATLTNDPTSSSLTPVNDEDGAGEGPSGADSKADLATGRWRWKRWLGYMGSLVQEYVLRPNKAIGTLVSPKTRPDMGMFHHSIDSSGYELTRSPVGLGLHKPYQIAVPKREFESDDPSGNTQPTPKQKKSFEFEMSDNPGAIASQLRDFYAWYCNNYIHQKRLEREKDWDIPDEASCPAPGSDPTAPKIGKWNLELAPLESAMGSGKQTDDEIQQEGDIKFRVGEAWAHILPTGDVSIKSACGCSIEMSGGHIKLSAPKGIELFSGASTVVMSGDDTIIKSNKAIDITSSQSQIRVKSEKETFIHAEHGGVLIDTGDGSQFVNKPGEKSQLPGITIKTNGGLTVVANTEVHNLSEYYSLTGQQDGSYPSLYNRVSGNYNWVDGWIAWKTSSGYTFLGDSGNFSTSGFMLAEGDCFVKGDGTFKKITEGGDWKDYHPLSESGSKTFDSKSWTDLQYPLKLSDLDNVKFTYRSMDECATTDMYWFCSYWQMDLASSLSAWTENQINETYPWPGKEHYSDVNNVLTYIEVNVESTGRPKSRDSQSPTAGKFKKDNFNSILIHPDR